MQSHFQQAPATGGRERPMGDLVPLHQLPSGSSGQVVQLVGHTEHVRRLEELGLRHGTTIEMVRRGRPCIIRISDGKVCFRQNESFHVLVRPIDGAV